MGLGHRILRRLIAKTPSNVDSFGLKVFDTVSCGSLVLGTALGAAGLAICAPSPALLDSQNSDAIGEDQMRERFPNAFSRKGEGSGQQEPYMAYNRDGKRVPLADIVQRMKVRHSTAGPYWSKYISLCCPKEAPPNVLLPQNADVVLLGETHDDSIAHQLQLQLMLGALKQVKRWAAVLSLAKGYWAAACKAPCIT